MRLKCAFALLLLSVTAFSQSFENYFEEFDVVLHQIQVNVLDKDGNPIKDLKKGDIEIKLDGKVQTIEAMEEIELESMVAGAQAESKPIPEQARRLFVFFFDLRFSSKQGIQNGQESAHNFVNDQMLPSDLASVFTFTRERGITMVTNFTSDAGHLNTAISTLGFADPTDVHQGPAGYYLESVLKENMSVNGFDANGLLRNEPGKFTSAGGPSEGKSAMASTYLEENLTVAQRTERKDYQREVGDFLAAMEQFGNGLRFIRGRKNLIWFSSGFDASGLVGVSMKELQKNAEMTALDGVASSSASFEQMGRGDIQGGTSKVIESLQAAGAMIFAVDTSRPGQSGDKAGIQTLNTFAKDTGGKVFTNKNKYDESLADIKQLTNHYYMVSFHATGQKRKTNVGKLRVKVKRSGAKVYTNRGLLLNPEFKNMTQIEKNIHLSEYMARDQVIRGIPVDVGMAAVPADNGLVKLNMGVAISGEYFVDPTRKKNKARPMELYVMAVDKVSDQVFDQTYYQFKADPAKLDAKVLGDTGLKYFANLFVVPGDYKFKVIARDLETGKVGSWIEMKTIEAPNAQVTAPVVLDEKAWVLMSQPEKLEKKMKSEALDFSFPFLIKGRPMVPAYGSTVPAGKSARFFYTLNYRENAEDMVEPRLRAMFMDSQKQVIQIPPNAIKADSDLRSAAPYSTGVVLSVDLSKVPLQAGSTYQLMVQFDLEGRTPIRSMSPIQVVDDAEFEQN